MVALAPHAQRAPRLGAIALRRLWRNGAARRWVIAAVAALSLATAAHHLLPMHDGMMPMGGMQHEHAMPVTTSCLGVVGAAFVLAYAGSAIRVRRSPRRRPLAAMRRAMRLPVPTGRPPCRDGPPPYLRLQVLRT